MENPGRKRYRNPPLGKFGKYTEAINNTCDKYLKPSIQNAMDKFELFVGPYELPAGKRIKLSGFFGTKDEIDVLLQCSKKLMELSLKKAQ